MMQIKIRFEGVDVYDLALNADDGDHLELDYSYDTAVLISLLTDREVDPSEALDPSDRGGYWGDSYPDVPGDRVGSRLWTLKGAKRTPETLVRAEGYVREALRWMVEDGILASEDDIGVELEFDGQNVLKGVVTLKKPKAPLDKWVVPWSYSLA